MLTNWKRRKLDLQSVCNFELPAEGKLTPAWDDKMIKSQSNTVALTNELIPTESSHTFSFDQTKLHTITANIT